MLENVVIQKMPYIVDDILSLQEYLMSVQLNVDILYVIPEWMSASIFFEAAGYIELLPAWAT